MAYSTDIVARARARLAQAKEDRLSQNRQHLEEAYAKLPRIQQIDMELRRTMAMTMRAVFSSGGDPAQAIEAVKEKNLALQKERAMLIAEHFPPGFLDENPICSRCGGSGYLGSNMCQCLSELCRQEQRKQISILAAGNDNFSQFRLDYYPNRFDSRVGANPRLVMEKTLQACRTYATTFTMNSGNLLFNGNTGLGKTFLSACIARTVTDRGYSVVYESASRLFSTLRDAHVNSNDDTKAAAAKYSNCDLLIIDDLGTEMPGQFVNAALYYLINNRLLDGKPILISTNLNIDEIADRYTPQIASRLHGNFQRLTFVGEDIRILKQRGYLV